MNDINEKKSKNRVSGFFLSLIFSIVATLIVFIVFNIK